MLESYRVGAGAELGNIGRVRYIIGYIISEITSKFEMLYLTNIYERSCKMSSFSLGLLEQSSQHKHGIQSTPLTAETKLLGTQHILILSN